MSFIYYSPSVCICGQVARCVLSFIHSFFLLSLGFTLTSICQLFNLNIIIYIIHSGQYACCCCCRCTEQIFVGAIQQIYHFGSVSLCTLCWNNGRTYISTSTPFNVHTNTQHIHKLRLIVFLFHFRNFGVFFQPFEQT